MKECAISFGWVTHSPSRLWTPVILFLRCLKVALLWKYLEFLSPPTSQKDLARCLHRMFSFTINWLISFISSLTQKFTPIWMAACSALLNSFLFSFSSHLMFPNFFLLHWVNLHFSIFFITIVSVSLWQGVPQTDSIVLPHPSLVSQTSSNRKILDNGGGPMPLGTI